MLPGKQVGRVVLKVVLDQLLICPYHYLSKTEVYSLIEGRYFISVNFVSVGVSRGESVDEIQSKVTTNLFPTLLRAWYVSRCWILPLIHCYLRCYRFESPPFHSCYCLGAIGHLYIILRLDQCRILILLYWIYIYIYICKKTKINTKFSISTFSEAFHLFSKDINIGCCGPIAWVQCGMDICRPLATAPVQVHWYWRKSNQIQI